MPAANLPRSNTPKVAWESEIRLKQGFTGVPVTVQPKNQSS